VGIFSGEQIRASFPGVVGPCLDMTSASFSQGVKARIPTRPTWVEVSLAVLRQNLRAIQTHVGNGVNICAVVKADAYGHGAVECSLALESEGARWFGVTSLDEGIRLREAGISSRILLMSGIWRGEEDDVVRLGLTPIVWAPWQVEALEVAARKAGVARHAVHFKLDTGMGRLGARNVDLLELCHVLRRTGHVWLEGVSTHLAASEVLDDPSVRRQIRRFEKRCEDLRSAGLRPTLLHIANTCAVIALAGSWRNMVRPGLALYGYHLPFRRASVDVAGPSFSLPVRQALQWKTEIMAVFEVGARQPLGYGGTHITRSTAHIAALPVGYADGFNRALSNRGRVILRGHYAPVVGRISMDLTLVDITGIPDAAVGDRVILIGSSDGLCVDAQEHAKLAGTIPYEVLCAISKRVPRRYVD
jgi:alanine racemase